MSRVELPFVESMYLNPSIAACSYMAKLVAEDGFAPPTRCSSGSRSTPELHGHLEIGCEGWNCTSGVSNVAGLQPAAFATTLTPQ